jgi:hypothetical protein
LTQKVLNYKFNKNKIFAPKQKVPRKTTEKTLADALYFKFCVVRTVHFGIKLYNDQRNAQVFNFIYLFTSALHALGFLLVHPQGQVYNFSIGSSLLGMVAAPGH